MFAWGGKTRPVFVTPVQACAPFGVIERALNAEFNKGLLGRLLRVFVRHELNRYRPMERYGARSVNDLVDMVQEELARAVKVGARA